MNQNWLIISYEPLASSLKRYLHACFDKPIEKLVLPRRFFDEDAYYDVGDYNNYYEAISKELCSYRSHELRHLVVVFTKWIDGIGDSTLWDPLHRHATESGKAHPQEILLSWLILSFPEVRWVFFKSISEGDRKDKAEAKTNDKAGSKTQNDQLKAPSTVQDCLSKNFHYFPFASTFNSSKRYPGFVPLFDPTGTRNRIREILREKIDNEGKQILEALPVRPLSAAAIDEEPVYAYMNAYIAYRFGYRAWALIDWQMTEKIFRENDSGANLIFEDLYLNFADRPLDFREESKFRNCIKKFPKQMEQHISLLEFRDCLLPKLKKVDERILVTVGHHKWRQDRERWQRNKHYLLALLSTRTKTLYKPFSGIFDLWRNAGKWKTIRQLPRYAKGFQWPPARSQQRFMLASGGHSAPGQLLVLAHLLLDRAQNILRHAEAVPETIHAAILALEAKELLANKTPTTALRALSLQHQAEITAESMFYGVEYNLNVKDRFKDIEREVTAISRWFNPKNRKRSELNARLAIIEKLARRFNELRQFEEEQECLAEARKIRFQFWMRQKPLRWAAWPFLKYLGIALSSLPRFLGLVFLWIIIFGFVYHVLPHPSENYTIWKAFSSSTTFFFTLQSNELWAECAKNYIIWDIILTFQGIISFFNLSLLISHFYIVLSRR